MLQKKLAYIQAHVILKVIEKLLRNIELLILDVNFLKGCDKINQGMLIIVTKSIKEC